jgi:hypothetical protein
MEVVSMSAFLILHIRTSRIARFRYAAFQLHSATVEQAIWIVAVAMSSVLAAKSAQQGHKVGFGILMGIVPIHCYWIARITIALVD